MNTVQPNPHNHQSGFGLVEILVALTLSTFLMGGIIQVYLANKQSYRMTEGLSRLQENARYSMKTLSLSLQPGGYRGCLGAKGDYFVNTLAVQTSAYDFAVSVTGTEGGTDPDTVTVRRAIGGASIAVVDEMAHKRDSIRLDANDPDYDKLQQYQILTISDCEAAAVFMITNDPQTSTSGGVGTIEHKTGIVAPGGGLNAGQSNTTEFLGHIFGAKTTSVATVYSSISVTYELGAGTSGQSLLANNQELVEGVQDFQVTYGLPDPGVIGNIQYLSASGGLNWPAVETLRVALTVDTVEDVTNQGTIEKTYGRTFRVRNRNP